MSKLVGIGSVAVVFAAMSMALAVGCGSSSGSAGSPGDSATLGSLSDGQRGAFCDDLAAIAGGYNKEKVLTCGDDAGGSVEITLSFDIGANQAECKTQFNALPAACKALTVGTLKTCVTDTYNSTCASDDNGPASCDPFFACAF